MARTKKVTESSSSEDILATICKIDEEINAKTVELKSLKSYKRTLNKWLEDAEVREAKERDEEALNRIVSLIKEKGMSVDDIEKMLDK